MTRTIELSGGGALDGTRYEVSEYGPYFEIVLPVDLPKFRLACADEYSAEMITTSRVRFNATHRYKRDGARVYLIEMPDGPRNCPMCGKPRGEE